MAVKRRVSPSGGRTPLPQSVRFNVLRRDNFTCRYCGRSSPDVVLHVDHKQPVSRGGSDSEANLVTACSECNGGKGAQVAVRVPGGRDAGMVGLFGLSFENDEVQYQFSIERVVGRDMYASQTYSWLDGAPVDVVVMTGAFLRSKNCRLFLTAELWHAATEDILEDCEWEQRRRLREKGTAADGIRVVGS